MKDMISKLINLIFSILIASLIVGIIDIFVDFQGIIEDIAALIVFVLSCIFYTLINKKKNIGLLIVNKVTTIKK